MTFGALALCLRPHHICADIHNDNTPELDDLTRLTSDVVLCTVQHICCVDELIAGASYPQFSLCVAQHYLPPAKTPQIIIDNPQNLPMGQMKCFFTLHHRPWG